eukprot:IDg17689t1
MHPSRSPTACIAILHIACRCTSRSRIFMRCKHRRAANECPRTTLCRKRRPSLAICRALEISDAMARAGTVRIAAGKTLRTQRSRMCVRVCVCEWCCPACRSRADRVVCVYRQLGGYIDISVDIACVAGSAAAKGGRSARIMQKSDSRRADQARGDHVQASRVADSARNARKFFCRVPTALCLDACSSARLVTAAHGFNCTACFLSRLRSIGRKRGSRRHACISAVGLSASHAPARPCIDHNARFLE